MLGKICSLFCSGAEADDTLDSLRAVLGSDGVGIVSARCCAPTSANQDDALEGNLREALSSIGRAPDYHVISITDAQKMLPKLKAELAAPQQRLVSQIQMMVATQGFSIFPILVIGGKVAYYGGLPSPEMIIDKFAPAKVASA